MLTLLGQTLAHCMKVARAKSIICTPDLAQFVADLMSQTDDKTPCICLNLLSFPALSIVNGVPATDSITQVRYEDLAAVAKSEPVAPAERKLKDVGALIYTSGTSGKPKAVSIKNFQ